jgi:hypothetical protein
MITMGMDLEEQHKLWTEAKERGWRVEIKTGFWPFLGYARWRIFDENDMPLKTDYTYTSKGARNEASRALDQLLHPPPPPPPPPLWTEAKERGWRLEIESEGAAGGGRSWTRKGCRSRPATQ